MFVWLIFRPGIFGSEVERVLGGGLVRGLVILCVCVFFSFFTLKAPIKKVLTMKANCLSSYSS